MNNEIHYIKQFYINAPYVDSDGTSDELLQVLIEHGQKDGTIIEKACEIISRYILFNMNIMPKFRSKTDLQYKTSFALGEEYDEEDWQLLIDNGKEGYRLVTPENAEGINYPEFDKMLQMFKFESRNFSSLSKEEQERHSKFRVPYGFLFSYLLDEKEF